MVNELLWFKDCYKESLWNVYLDKVEYQNCTI